MLTQSALAQSSEALLAARLLREEILLFPVSPGARAGLVAGVVAENAARAATGSGDVAGAKAALSAARSIAQTWDGLVVTAEQLQQLAAAAGGGGWRMAVGQPFEGRASPPAAGLGALVEDLLERVNSPVSVEAWPPPARAFALGYLLRLVQPFAAPPAVVAFAAESLLLAADGFVCDRMLLPPPPGRGVQRPRPDPDAYVEERLDALPASLGDTLDRLRSDSARELLLGWAQSRDSGLNARQLRAMRHLAAEAGRTLTFADYLTMSAGPRGPSLRSLQRDWRDLRERGLLEDVPGARRIADSVTAWEAGT